jgi:hypothetical protein
MTFSLQELVFDMSLLHLAAHWSRESFFKWLLEKSAIEPEEIFSLLKMKNSYGYTPLYQSAISSDEVFLMIMRFLLSYIQIYVSGFTIFYQFFLCYNNPLSF